MSLIAHLGKYSTLGHRKLMTFVYARLTVYRHSRLLPLCKRTFEKNSVSSTVYCVAYVQIMQ